MKILGKLGCFTRASLSHHDDSLVIPDESEKLGPVLEYGEGLPYSLHRGFELYFGFPSLL